MRSLVYAAVCLIALSAAARADGPTPFYDDNFKVGETYEQSATVAWMGGTKYLLLVRSDTVEVYVVWATAKEGVVTPEKLGGQVVKAKVLSREKAASGQGGT